VASPTTRASRLRRLAMQPELDVAAGERGGCGGAIGVPPTASSAAGDRVAMVVVV
jgi:hypothetical protein